MKRKLKGNCKNEIRESLEEWRQRAERIANRPSSVPSSILKSVYVSDDHAIWNLNYRAFQKAGKKASNCFDEIKEC